MGKQYIIEKNMLENIWSEDKMSPVVKAIYSLMLGNPLRLNDSEAFGEIITVNRSLYYKGHHFEEFDSGTKKLFLDELIGRLQ